MGVSLSGLLFIYLFIIFFLSGLNIIVLLIAILLMSKALFSGSFGQDI